MTKKFIGQKKWHGHTEPHTHTTWYIETPHTMYGASEMKKKKVVTCLDYTNMNRPRRKSKNLSPNCLLSEHLEQGGWVGKILSVGDD